MIKGLSQKVVRYQVEKGIIENEESRIYEYGYEIFFCQIINILTAIMIALIFRYFLILIFLVAYIPIRIYAGGDHASSSEKCMITSAVILLAISTFGKYILSGVIGDFFYLIEIPAIIIIGLLAPVESKNKPLEADEAKRYKKYAYVITGIEALIAFLSYMCGKKEIGNMLVLTHMVMAGILIVGKIKLKKAV